MSKINYQELREAAEQATQDEWVAYILPGHNGIYPARTSEGRHCGYFIDWPGIDGQKNAGANARYIAAIPPKVALALLGEIKRLEDTNIDAMCRISELETNLAALAAENIALKSAHPQQFGQKMMDALVAYEECQDDVPERGMLNAFFILRDSVCIDTPATGAFLAEVRAQGLEMFAQKCNSKSEQSLAFDIRDNWKLLGEHATDFAAELRKGGSQ